MLIPQEFSLVLSAPERKRMTESRVHVWSNARIPQGTLIYPFQGTIRLDKLDVYAYLEDNDVSIFIKFLLLLLLFLNTIH